MNALLQRIGNRILGREHTVEPRVRSRFEPQLESLESPIQEPVIYEHSIVSPPTSKVVSGVLPSELPSDPPIREHRDRAFRESKEGENVHPSDREQAQHHQVSETTQQAATDANASPLPQHSKPSVQRPQDAINEPVVNAIEPIERTDQRRGAVEASSPASDRSLETRPLDEQQVESDAVISLRDDLDRLERAVHELRKPGNGSPQPIPTQRDERARWRTTSHAAPPPGSFAYQQSNKDRIEAPQPPPPIQVHIGTIVVRANQPNRSNPTASQRNFADRSNSLKSFLDRRSAGLP